MALDNLEQMHPRYLAELLENGGLRKVLSERVAAYAGTLERLRQSMPSEPEETLQEIAQAEHLTPTNQEWQDQEPLTPEEKRKLKAFQGGLK
jgi:hypothetical protein